MTKVIFSILLVYALAISIALPLKRFVREDSRESLSITEVVIAPMLVAVIAVVGLLDSGEKICLIGCGK